MYSRVIVEFEIFKIYSFSTVLVKLLSHSMGAVANITYSHDHAVRHIISYFDDTRTIEQILMQSSIQEAIFWKPAGNNSGIKFTSLTSAPNNSYAPIAPFEYKDLKKAKWLFIH